MKIKSRLDSICFYNDNEDLIASFNKFYNKIYTGKMLHIGELEEIKKYLDKKKHKGYVVFSMSDPLPDDGEDLAVIEEDVEEEATEEKPKRKRRTKTEIEAEKEESKPKKKTTRKTKTK